MSKKVITFGEIMLRLATPGYLRFAQANSFNAVYGGGEANVAVSVANYGLESSFVTRLPNNDIGTACEMELRKHGVDTSNSVKGGERLGIYFLETGAVARASKVVYDRAYSSFSTIEKGMINWDEVLEGIIDVFGAEYFLHHLFTIRTVLRFDKDKDILVLTLGFGNSLLIGV